MRPLLERLALHRPELRASLALTLSLTVSGRIVILATSVLFIADGVVLSGVDVERGKEAARAAKGIS